MSDLKIYVNFIMKNEQAVLNRMLTSILPIVDGCICIDTGSTDNSKAIVQEFFDSRGIPCEIYDHPFVNFSNARNFALSKVKGKGDFAFWIDCDEQMEFKPDFDKAVFLQLLSTIDAGNIMVKYAGSEYARRVFFRTDKACHWQGAVHEILLWDEPMIEKGFDKLYIVVNPDGSSWTSQTSKEKYLSHARILEAEIKKTNDPRDVFYLAQSYRDAGEGKKAVDWYRKRVLMNSGFTEEKYYAQLMIGTLNKGLGRPVEQLLMDYFNAHEIDNLRGEHIVNLIILLQDNNMWQTAYIFSKYAIEKYHKKSPYPNRQLFLDAGTYDWKLMDMHILNCQKTGNDYVSLIPKNTLDELFNSLPSAWKGHKEFASWLVNFIKPAVTVDLGVDYGYSTFCFALPKIGKVYGVDHFQGDSSTGFRNTQSDVMANVKWLKEKYGISNIEILNTKFTEVINMSKEKIDILHIDGCPQEIEDDYNKWSPLVKDTGVILLHNTQSWGDVKKFFALIDLPKLEFEHSGGLGIVCRDESVLSVMRDKYFTPDKITIGYIAHDAAVNNKYVSPSLEKLVGEFDIVTTTDTAMPGVNYNDIIDRAKTKYVLLIHEDVTFSSDFLLNIQKTIAAHPDFGAIGAVGTDTAGVYQWGEVARSKEVQRLDCCCILINKEHGIRFDTTVFDEYHLYVEDYCLQVINTLGLKCYTILTNAFEAQKGMGYEPGVNYFRHHSHTVNERGYCWGRYFEFLSKLENKWSPIKTYVDVCIISYAKTEELRLVTVRGIESLLASETDITFNVFVVESNKSVSYDDYVGVTTIYTPEPFGYNKYLNIAVGLGSADYVVLCNNDLTFEKGWATEIIRQMKINPAILSASPFCPQTNPVELKKHPVIPGHQVRGQLAGWCIFQQRKVYNIIGKLNEGVDFWFSDNIYADQLISKKIVHALITNSVVNHHEHNLGVSGNSILDEQKKSELTMGQHQKYLQAKSLIS